MAKGSSPKVSIILPTHNGERYLRQSLESCLGQTYSNVECIVVDDCSSDGTPSIIKEFEGARLKCIRHLQNKGLPAALNTGFAQATGDYLTWTSDDNYYAPNAIEEMVDVLKGEKSDFVYCDFYSIHDYESQAHESQEMDVISQGDLPLEKGNYIGPCFLYTRKVKETVGDYDTDLKLVEDYDYWIRVSQKFKMTYARKAIYYYRFHDNSLAIRSKDGMVKALTFLVRLKNKVLSPDEVKQAFLEILAECQNKKLRFKGSLRLYRFWMKLMFNQKIDKLLRSWESKSIPFAQLKDELLKLVDRYE